MLESTKDHFCAEHHQLDQQCAIVGCAETVLEGSRTCSNPVHQEVERVNITRGQSRFILKERLQRQRVSHPNDSVAVDVSVDELDDPAEVEEEFLVSEAGRVIPDESSSAAPLSDPDVILDNSAHRQASRPAKIRAKFGRNRTHNEQIIVTPCGIILARETFYGAEAVSSVIVGTLSTIISCSC
jgi:CxC6 like cysteine cluster associated with KDZ transposases